MNQAAIALGYLRNSFLAIDRLEVGSVSLDELLQGIIYPEFLRKIFVQNGHFAFIEMFENAVERCAISQAIRQMRLEFGWQHRDGPRAEFGRFLAPELVKGSSCDRQEFRDIIGGLGKSAVTDLIVDIVARVEKLNPLWPVGELLVALIQGRGDIFYELAMIRVVGRIAMRRQNLLQAETV